LDEIRKVGQKYGNLVKNEILVKQRNFGQKKEILAKNEMLVKKQNFGQKTKFFPKNEMFAKKRNFDKKNRNFGQIFFVADFGQVSAYHSDKSIVPIKLLYFHEYIIFL